MLTGSSLKRVPTFTFALTVALAVPGPGLLAPTTHAQGGRLATVEWVGSTGGFVTAVATSDETVYAAIGAHLEIYRATDRAELIGQSSTFPAPIRALATDDGFVAVALGEEGLWIVDARVPSLPTTMEHLDLDGVVADVSVKDGRAFATVISQGALDPPDALVIIDVSNPSTLREIGRVQVPRLGSEIDVDGPHAFVISDTTMLVFDITGAIPVQVGMLGGIGAIDVQGARAIAINTSGTAAISLDMTDPALPSQLGRVALPGDRGPTGPRTVTLAGQGAFVSVVVARDVRDRLPWLGSIDLTDPRQPALAVSAPLGGLAMAPAVDATFVAADDLGLIRISHNRAFGRPLVASAKTEQWLLPEAERAVIHGNRAYLMGRDSIYITQLDVPILSVAGEIAGKSTILAAEGDVLYRGAFDEGGGTVESINIQRSDRPLTIGRTPVKGMVSRLVASDKTLYALTRVDDDPDPARVEYSHSIQILDASDPARITPMSRTILRGRAVDMSASPPFIYVLVSDVSASSLQTFNAIDPSRPVLVASLSLPQANFHFLHVDGRTAFVSSSGKEPALHLVDITDPTRPRRIGVLPSPRQARIMSMVGSGSLVAISQDEVGLQVFDFDVALRPAVTGLWDLFNTTNPTLPNRVFMGEGWILTSSKGPGVGGQYYQAYPTHQVGMLEHTYFQRAPWRAARDVEVVGARSFVGSDDRGLDLVDTSQIDRPRIVTPSIRPDLWVRRVVVEGDTAYTSSQNGVTITDVASTDAWLTRSNLSPTSSVSSNYSPGFGPALAVASGKVYVPVHHYDRVRMVSPPRVDVIDVTDPSAPTRVSSLSLSIDRSITDLSLLGRSLLVTAEDGLRMVDVTSPRAPSIRWLANPGETLREVESFGESAFVLSPSSLQRISTDRALPDDRITSYSSTGQLPEPRGLTLSRLGWGRYAALIAPEGEIHVWDVSLGAPSCLVVSIPIASWQPVDISLNGPILQVLSDRGGLMLLRLNFPPLTPPAHLAYLPHATIGR